MSKLANIPVKLIKTTKDGKKLFLTVVQDDHDTGTTNFIGVCLTREKAKSLAHAIFELADKLGGE